MDEWSGGTDGRDLRVTLVVARFNELAVRPLVHGARAALLRCGVPEQGLRCVWVPGGFELPLVAEAVARRGDCDAMVALAAVIRGETPHFDYVAGEAARGLASVARRHQLPVAFGVLTTNSLEQALDRAGGKHGNKGEAAALVAVEMATLLRRLRSHPGGGQA
ncbi:MAG TPA: 6,7-dimethyl-8-ribityllumazine synthase [Candidatus Micrarchaeia archaeon]|nr:6,7-dimethyl-8-ribityllumazine synthase [Candidatus Micrarchaeia archaeon]